MDILRILLLVTAFFGGGSVSAAHENHRVTCDQARINSNARLSVEIRDQSTGQSKDRVDRLTWAACLAVSGALSLGAVAESEAESLRFVVVDHINGDQKNAAYMGEHTIHAAVGLLDDNDVHLRFGIAHELGHAVHWDKAKQRALGFLRILLVLAFAVAGFVIGRVKGAARIGLATFGLIGSVGIFWAGNIILCAGEKPRELAADEFAVRVIQGNTSHLESAKSLAIQVMQARPEAETDCSVVPTFAQRTTGHPSTAERIAAIRKITAPMNPR